MRRIASSCGPNSLPQVSFRRLPSHRGPACFRRMYSGVQSYKAAAKAWALHDCSFFVKQSRKVHFYHAWGIPYLLEAVPDIPGLFARWTMISATSGDLVLSSTDCRGERVSPFLLSR